MANTKPQYAGFWLRALATAIDLLIIFLISTIFQYTLGRNPFEIFNASTLEDWDKIEQTNDVYFNLILSGLVMLYDVAFWVNFNGATPGKKFMGIAIVRNDGSKINYAVGIIRYFGTLLSTVGFGLGYLWVIWDPKKQAWHDKMVDTSVIKTGQKPKIWLGILSCVIYLAIITLFCVAFGFTMIKVLENSNAYRKDTTKSIESQSNALKPEAKIHYDKSQELFKQLREKSSTVTEQNLDEFRNLGDQTITEAKLAVDAEPDNAFLWSNLANAYTWNSHIGKPGDAYEAALKAYNLEPTNVIYSNVLGDQLIAQGKNQEAVLQLQKSIRMNDNSGFAHQSLGKAYKNLKIYDEAKKHYEESITIFQKYNDDGRYDDEILISQKEMANMPN